MLYDVLYLPEFNFNLLSISKVVRTNHCNVIFSNGDCVIQDLSLKRTGSGKLKQGLYHLEYGGGNIVPVVGNISVNNDLLNSDVFSIPKKAIWHFRFGHASHAKLEMLCKDFPSIHVNKDLVCDVCHYARQKRLPFSLSSSRAAHPFDLVHLDVWGPCSLPSIHGYKYFLTIVDDNTRYTWISLLKGKFEVQNKVMLFLAMVENQFGKRVKIIRSDNGTEFKMGDLCVKKGILHQFNCVETPEQNARVERKHQHILSVARALMLQSSLPKYLCSYSIQHVVYLINRMPSLILNQNSPITSYCMENYPSLMISECLVVFALCLPWLPAEPSLTKGPANVFFWDSGCMLKVLWCMMCTLKKFWSQGISCFMSTCCLTGGLYQVHHNVLLLLIQTCYSPHHPYPSPLNLCLLILITFPHKNLTH